MLYFYINKVFKMEPVSHFLFHKYVFPVTFEDVSFYIYKKGKDRCL